MKFRKQFDEAKKIADSISDWDDSDFCWKKAFVSSAFSAIAYEEVPRFELKKSKRAKIIPCDSYQAHISRWEQDKKTTSIKESDFNIESEVVIKTNVLVTITRLKNVIFVSFRGTTLSFADFKADLDVRKARFHFGFGESTKLHRGFLNAVLECFDEVVDRIRALRDPIEIPVYLTGHSLGGAMAAIFYGMLEQHNHPLIYRKSSLGIPIANSCYSFGMPRYGDIVAKSMLPQPIHIYNEFDAIPTLPPKILGFVDSANERCLNAIPDVLVGIRKGDFALRKGRGIATILGISDHRMERYLERTREMMEK